MINILYQYRILVHYSSVGRFCRSFIALLCTERDPSRPSTSASQSAFVFNERHNGVEALPHPQIRHHEGARAAHPARIAFHDLERGPDMRREVDLVDDEK